MSTTKIDSVTIGGRRRAADRAKVKEPPARSGVFFTAEADAQFLQALFQSYSAGDQYHGCFDEHSISAHAAYERPALAPIRLRLTRGRYLSLRSTDDVRRWLDALVGRPIGGLVLVRDRAGWLHVRRVVESTPPRGRA
jgi:hypothetical protein